MGLAAGGNYFIRVARTDAVGGPGLSLAPFNIAPATTVFYVNDGTVQSGDWSTAPGDDSNDGLTPATPKASIAGLLAAYPQLGAGVVIHVDEGNYTLTSNIVLAVIHSGLTIEGFNDPNYPGRIAVLDRGNTNGGSDVFDLTGATGVTLDHLSITGGFFGVNVPNGVYSTNLTISNCDISDYYIPVFIGNSNSGAMILNNYIHDNANNNSGNAGLSINSENSTISGNLIARVNNGLILSAGSGTVTGNTVTSNPFGIAVYGSGGPRVLITNNIVSGNSYQGLNAYGNVLVTNNQIYGNHANGNSVTGLLLRAGGVARGNFIHDNDIGVTTDSSTLENNRIYHNTWAGVYESSGTIIGNTIFGNAVGIYGSGYGFFQNNLIYANTSAGVQLYGGNGLFDSNTVYQTAGDAFDLTSNASNFTLRDNILVSAAGFPESITADSETGFSSDYNDLVAAPNAALFSWGGQLFSTRSSLFYELGLEQHGQTSDPQFVNPAGPDGILGFGTGSIGAATIIDDGGIGYSETGSWMTVPGGYGNGADRQPTGNYTGATANYTYTGLTPGGYYEIAATWPADGDTSAVYSIQSGVQMPLTVTVNQGIPSAGFMDAGGVWQPLGVFRADSSTLTVTMIGNYVDMEADAIRLQAVQGDGSADDNFAVQSGSPTIDAGSPVDSFSAEPAPNGGRANLGYTGGTAQATTSPAELVQVTYPNGLEKLVAGQKVNITWRSAGGNYPPADYATTVLADNPAVYLRLAETSGTSAADASGNGLTGVVSGDVTLGSAGVPTTSADSAYQFNGVNGTVTVPDMPAKGETR